MVHEGTVAKNKLPHTVVANGRQVKALVFQVLRLSGNTFISSFRPRDLLCAPVRPNPWKVPSQGTSFIYLLHTYPECINSWLAGQRTKWIQEQGK